MQNPFAETHPVFNAQFNLLTEDNEFRMSHWVKGFGISAATGEMILPLNTSFDLEKCEEAGNVLKVTFRVYPNGGVRFDAEIDPFQRVFMYAGEIAPLHTFHAHFEQLSDKK
ncbi:MAG: hypothetical protein IM638_06920 [Bacteroidetes bacterium]|nr:hypothetical protein [Bacteroidota bacterium]